MLRLMHSDTLRKPSTPMPCSWATIESGIMQAVSVFCKEISTVLLVTILFFFPLQKAWKMEMSCREINYWTRQYWTEQYWTDQYWTEQYWTVLDRKVLDWAVLDWTVLDRTEQHWTEQSKVSNKPRKLKTLWDKTWSVMFNLLLLPSPKQTSFLFLFSFFWPF